MIVTLDEQAQIELYIIMGHLKTGKSDLTVWALLGSYAKSLNQRQVPAAPEAD